MKSKKWIVAAAIGALGTGGVLAQSTPIGPREAAVMRGPGPKAVPMLSACSPTVPLDVIEAFIDKRMKATVFVSAKAIESESKLADLIALNRDLFEVGNLGEDCQNKKPLVGNLRENYAKGIPERELDIKSMTDMAESMLKGSAAIEKRFGTKPRFFAFGMDFFDPMSDPFEQTRLLLGVGDYLAKPTAATRYDALAKAKAGFGAWVFMGKLDRTGTGSPSALDSQSRESIDRKLDKASKGVTSMKASEAWIPAQRGPLAREIEAEMRRSGKIIPPAVGE